MCRRIPNWLVLPFLVAGVAVSGWAHGWHGLEQSMGGMAVGALLFGAVFCMGGMGMGDVKLCAAIGAWIGPGQMVTALVLTGLAGGVLAVCWAVWGGFMGEMLQGAGELMLGWLPGWKQRGSKPRTELVLTHPRARKMPYAPAIAAGTLISFFAR
jgi:prepilin peptidase CpaA